MKYSFITGYWVFLGLFGYGLFNHNFTLTVLPMTALIISVPQIIYYYFDEQY